MKTKIDLLPPEERKPGINVNQILVIILIIVFLAVLSLGHIYDYYWETLLQTQTEILEQKLTKKIALRREYKNLQAEVENLNSRIEEIEKFDDDINWSDMLVELGYIMPEDTYLTSFTCNSSGKVSLNGFSLDYSLVVQLINNIDKCGYFTDVNLQRTTTRQEEEMGRFILFFVQSRYARGSDMNVQ